MNYLAIGNATNRIVYSIFENKKLLCYGDVPYKSVDTLQQLVELDNLLNNVIESYKIDYLVTKEINLLTTKREKALAINTIKTIIRYRCAKKNVIYFECDTYGWEKYLRKVTKKDKIRIINEAYNLDLTKSNNGIIKDNQEPIADVIMLGEVIANQRIKVIKQPINYKLRVGK